MGRFRWHVGSLCSDCATPLCRKRSKVRGVAPDDDASAVSLGAVGRKLTRCVAGRWVAFSMSVHARSSSRVDLGSDSDDGSDPDPVTFHAPGGGESFQIQGNQLTSRADACASSCTLELLPGKYMLYLMFAEEEHVALGRGARAESGQPFVKVSPTRAPIATEGRGLLRRPRWAFAPALEPHGAGLRLGWSF